MATARYEYQSDFARKYFAQGEAKGEAKGKAEMLLRLLELKGFAVSDTERERILECVDIAQLDAWADRVLIAESLADVFDA